MTVRETLIKALALIEKGWCQGANAKDKEGYKVTPFDPTATQFCVIGALCKVNPNLPLPLPAKLMEHLPANDPALMIAWNDEPGRLKAEVVELFRRAINE